MNPTYSILLFFLLSVFTSCDRSAEKKSVTTSEGQEQSVISPGTRQMMDSIASIKSKVNYRNHPYEMTQKLNLIEAEVNTLKAQQKLNPQLYIEYGKTLLNVGRSEEAVLVFEEILELLPENKVINQDTKTLHEVLALSYLRIGEQTNCRDNHSTESCLFPIKGKGIHSNRSGSEHAIEIYTKILTVFPDDLQSQWLLNLAYMTLGEYPKNVPPTFLIPPKAFASEYPLPAFENISMYLGIDVNELAGGVVTDDFDNDGFIDILTSSWGLSGHLTYFRNEGNGTFSNQTERSGLKNLTGGLNLIQADYNNDGFLDIYCLRGAWSGYAWMGHLPNSLIKNNGDGTFTDVTIEAGMYGEHPTQSAVWMDYNHDGWIDLFVGNETHSSMEIHPVEMYENQKNGTFKEVSEPLGLSFSAYVKGTAASDINNDGLTDLYVSILDGANKLFLNKGKIADSWAFEEVANRSGVTEPKESFPTWFFDYDNDGDEDLFVSAYDSYTFREASFEVAADYLGKNIRADFPRLYENLGDGKFKNVTRERHLNYVLPTMGCNIGDLDNDGYLDFYLGTGAPDFRSVIPNRMFRNNEGVSFQDVTFSGNFGHVQKGHAIAFADIDNDGDQDIYAVMGGALTGDIFQNAFFENPGNKNQWITLRLHGTKSNRAAIGAHIKITVENRDGSVRHIYHTVSSGGSFGANSLQAEIGLGDIVKISSISVKWPLGTIDFINYGPATPNKSYSITEGDLKLTPLSSPVIKFQKEGKHAMSH